jgi:hypothetical protein
VLDEGPPPRPAGPDGWRVLPVGLAREGATATRD